MGESQRKRLVVCCDGTWNLPDQRCPTNVTKVALAVSPTDEDGIEQRVFYHHGVGTHPWDRLRGGAFGLGLSRDVLDIYRFLVRNYEPGDELFFFGFSRGAFTARSAVGLVRNAGILRPENIDMIPKAYRLYRSRTDIKTPRGREAILFRRSYSYEPRIRFIGVWDTVGALGIPWGPTRFIRFVNKRWEFHNPQLSTLVDSAYQALAIDEKRKPFTPCLWTVRSDAPPHQEVQQVWFTGVHCDVGGGNPNHALSDIPLLWMADRARSCGLAFREDAFIHEPDPSPPDPKSQAEPEDEVRRCTRVMPDPFVKFDDSCKSFYSLIGPSDRQPNFGDPSQGVAADPSQKIASTAVKRHLNENPKYVPANFVQYLDDDQSEKVTDVSVDIKSR